MTLGDWLSILLTIGVLALVLVFAISAAMLVLGLPVKVRKMQIHIDALQQNIRHLRSLFAGKQPEVNNMALDHETHLELIESKISQLRQRIDEIDARSVEDRTYTQAIKLAERGVSIEDIISSCNISQQEAELIITLHRSSDT